jgi:hypothetical protein
LNVVGAPTFTSPSAAAFQTGVAGEFEIRTNTLSVLTYAGSLPRGLFFGGSPGVLRVFGTPEPGTGGEYKLLVTATVGPHSTTQSFRLSVHERIKIVSPATINLVRGVQNTFYIETTGYPKAPKPDFAGVRLGGPPSGGPPAGVTFTEVVNNGSRTGTFVIRGVPTSSNGPYSMFYSLVNGAGGDLQSLTMRVINAGDLNADGVVNCSDVSMVRTSLNTRLGQAVYNNLADSNNDGVIDIRDIAYVSAKLPAGTRCN